MIVTKEVIDTLSYEIIGAAIEVHKALGPGLLESIYEKCLIKKLTLRDLKVKSQIHVPINYKGLQVDADLKLDLIVEDLIVIEIKAIEQLSGIHTAQLLSYMRLLEKPKGVLINFCCTNIVKEGQKTFVNEHYALLPNE